MFLHKQKEKGALVKLAATAEDLELNPEEPQDTRSLEIRP